jgi:Arm DNA-binding domain
MPNHDLTKRPSVAKIKPSHGNTTFYSDPSIKSDPDARGIRLAVGAVTKTWVLSKRIDGKLRSIKLGSWPELPTLFAARDVAKEKMGEIDPRVGRVAAQGYCEVGFAHAGRPKEHGVFFAGHEGQ